MTSEKFRYQPITEMSSNPELIILKTGKVEYREPKESLVKRSTIPRPRNDLSGAAKLKEETSTCPRYKRECTRATPSLERASSKGRMTTKGIQLTPRNPANLPTIGADSLKEADGFHLSVKITPKPHPGNSKPQ